MEKSDYYKLTKDFPEFNILLDKQKTLRKEINRTSRRVKTLSENYSFIKKIVGINIGGDILEQNIKNYFKAVGFNDVRKVGNATRKDDLQIHFSDKLIIIETTGIKGKNTSDSKTRQITKHLEKRRSDNENVYGIFLVNHDKQTYFKERNENPFSIEQIEYAIIGRYSLVTTIELLKGFIKVKMNELTLNEYEKKLCSFGVVKF